MEYLYERVSYLRGLADGLQISEDSKEGKLLLQIVDVLEEFADAINELAEAQNELDEYVECIDEDLADVEEEVFDDVYEDDYDDYDDYVEVECPHCSQIVCVEEDVFEDDDTDVICPSCHEPIYTEYEDDDQEGSEENQEEYEGE